jgi:hypothetical protein
VSVLGKLKRVEPPKPVERKACQACKAFAAECEVPDGEGALSLCWPCAHHIVDHGVTVENAAMAECECHPYQIYPDRRDRVDGVFRVVHGDLTYEQIQHALREDGVRGSLYNAKTGNVEPFHIPPSTKRN